MTVTSTSHTQKRTGCWDALFGAGAKVTTAMEFLAWHLVASGFSSISTKFSIRSLVGIPLPLVDEEALDGTAALIYLGADAFLAFFSTLFAMILWKGFDEKRHSYVKCWFGYYIVSWIGTCINVAYSVSAANNVAPAEMTQIFLLLIISVGILTIVWSVTNIWSYIQNPSESRRQSQVSMKEAKEGEKMNAPWKNPEPVKIEISESTYLLILNGDQK